MHKPNQRKNCSSIQFQIFLKNFRFTVIMNNNPPAKQFTPEQRNLLCLAYERHKGKARGTMNVQEEFRLKYPDSKVPLQSTIYRIYSKKYIFCCNFVASGIRYLWFKYPALIYIQKPIWGVLSGWGIEHKSLKSYSCVFF